jgi:prepilin peptidase CpaA
MIHTVNLSLAGERLRVQMSMPGFSLLIIALTACVVVTAAVCDLRQRRIPNALTITAIGFGVAAHTAHSGWKGLWFSLLGMAIGGGVFLLFHFVGGMGAGDVKLMGGVGAFLGFRLVLSVLVFTGIAGGLMAAGKLVLRHMKRHGRDGAIDPSSKAGRPAAEETGRGGMDRRSALKETIPYGVAIAAGTLITLSVAIMAGGISR